MLETFDVASSSGRYEVVIGVGNLTNQSKTLEVGDVALVDQNVNNFWGVVIRDNQKILIDSVEQNKTLEHAATLIELLRIKKMHRDSHLYSYGGGVVQDLSTFVASVYMRGIAWTYCPTTLLGMVDSCIGGKSSLNVGKFKNIAGNFHPPKKILIDINFCETLNTDEKIAGLCEAAKICFASNQEVFNSYLNIFSGQYKFASPHQLYDIVRLSLRAKKIFIEEDEFDRGVRLLLNFGHTFGHAIEGATNFSITHGVAVGLGMLAEIELGKKFRNNVLDANRTISLINHIKWLLSQVNGLSSLIGNLDVNDALLRFKSDKKHSSDYYSVVIVNDQGFLERISMPISNYNDSLILNSFEKIKKDINNV